MHNTPHISHGIAAQMLASVPKSVWEWIKRTFSPAYQSEVELYLAQATDHADLTRRLKYLQYRGMI
jgi:hypothetical protein